MEKEKTKNGMVVIRFQDLEIKGLWKRLIGRSGRFKPEQGDIFIWALLYQMSEHGKLSSLWPVFKDDMWPSIETKAKEKNITFEEADFDTIISFLVRKHLIIANVYSIALYRENFVDLFHQAYGWLDYH